MSVSDAVSELVSGPRCKATDDVRQLKVVAIRPCETHKTGCCVTLVPL